MKWDNSANCGFSSNSPKGSTSVSCDNNVKKKLARGETLPRIYAKLAKLRQEPSFAWGQIQFPSSGAETHNLVAFVRKADGFAGYLVVANTGTNESAVDFSKFFDKSVVLPDTARVEYFSSSGAKDDFELNKQIDINNIYLKQGEVLVLKF
jgi:hypothetical protein